MIQFTERSLYVYDNNSNYSQSSHNGSLVRVGIEESTRLGYFTNTTAKLTDKQYRLTMRLQTHYEA